MASGIHIDLSILHTLRVLLSNRGLPANTNVKSCKYPCLSSEAGSLCLEELPEASAWRNYQSGGVFCRNSSGRNAILRRAPARREIVWRHVQKPAHGEFLQASFGGPLVGTVPPVLVVRDQSSSLQNTKVALGPGARTRRSDAASPEYSIFLGSPSFHQLVQQLAQLIADAKSGKELPFCIQFHWTADKVESLHSKLLRQRDISNLISRFEYD
ncbi:hypothetical protein B0T25DRAFT_53639 [Lasiosphaeria hispida]|uniref:Uncharacterized protein n=1 Tax=Lasiosphaeria hispida TaxID=260671 RepID=A0AAJ0HVQ3_9PEZI|nr:hypothetical protein B0T25DRAFT_53639 [Lasiosphaeria hispida]